MDPEAPYRSSLRKTNPVLFRSLLVVAIGSCALGFNFLLTTPTFEQFGIPKNAIGAGFLTIGVAELTFVLLFQNLKVLRVVLMIDITYMLFWGIGTTATFFTGDSSLQLFILYWTLAAMKTPLVLEPFRATPSLEVVEEEQALLKEQLEEEVRGG